MALCPGSALEHFIGSLINVGPGQLRLCCLKKPRKSYSFGKVICIPSTWRELKAVDQVLRSFAEKLAGHRVKWFTDNQNVVRIVQSGSRRQHLQDGAMSIFEVCLANNIRLDIAWIPRSLNDRADFISRIVTMMIGSCAHAYFTSLMTCGVPTQSIGLHHVTIHSSLTMIVVFGTHIVELSTRSLEHGQKESTGGFPHRL